MKNLIGNRVTEKDLRQWLDNNGYDGCSARFQELELHAIKRPGWIQVFRFAVHTRFGGSPLLLFGVVRDDERRGMQVFVDKKLSARQSRLAEWSAGMASCRNENIKPASVAQMMFFATIMVSIVLVIAIATIFI